VTDGRQHPAILASDADHRAFCSRIVRSGPWELPVRSSYRCLFGTIDLDLSQVRLPGAEVEIEIFNRRAKLLGKGNPHT
jgi:hypothetical protein